MKKYIFAAILLVFVVVGTASALTPLPNSEYIAQLRAQIAKLTEQLNQLLAQQNSGECYAFDRDLYVGLKWGPELVNLHNLLTREGISVDRQEMATFGYNENVAAAIVKLQAKYGIRQTGYFGPLTRGKLNQLYGCKNNKLIIVTSPNGGETWEINTQQNVTKEIRYKTTGGLAGTNILVSLENSERSIDLYNVSNLTFPEGIIGVPLFLVGSQYNKNIPTGQYKLKLALYNTVAALPCVGCQSSSNKLSEDVSDGFITITNSNQSQITVTSPNGGEQWVAKTVQQIKWGPNACTANGAPCVFPQAVDLYLDQKYECNAGPGLACIALESINYDLDKNIPWNSVYNWIVATDINDKPIPAGVNYYLRICIAGTNTCDSSDRPFTITDSTQSRIINVLSPNGGEQWQTRSVQTIRWAPGPTVLFAPDAKVDLYLDPYSPPCTMYCPSAPAVPTAILDKNIAARAVYNWIVATDIDNKVIPPGNYHVRVCLAGTNTCDSSDQPFTIVGQ